MNNKKSYNLWAPNYDQDENKTRDLEAKALRSVLGNLQFKNCLEIGCGTGKNTVWLLERGAQVTAVDFSEEMLKVARNKIKSEGVQFIQADITREWNFGNFKYDLIVFSLVLEHIDDINSVFEKAGKYLRTGGFIYVGELHPFKQFTGSKARYTREEELTVLECYTHNISEFITAAKKANLTIADLNEFFDEGNNHQLPRVLTLLFSAARDIFNSGL